VVVRRMAMGRWLEIRYSGGFLMVTTYLEWLSDPSWILTWLLEGVCH
jgi:hypothetical protein